MTASRIRNQGLVVGKIGGGRIGFHSLLGRVNLVLVRSWVRETPIERIYIL